LAEQTAIIGGCLFRECFYGHLFEGGDGLCNLGNVGWFGGAAWERVGVSFEQEVIEGDARDCLTERGVFRARDGFAKGEDAAQGEPAPGACSVANEVVDDDGGRGVCAWLVWRAGVASLILDDLLAGLLRALLVQDAWQGQFAGQPKLKTKGALLGFLWGGCFEQIKAGFANGDDFCPVGMGQFSKLLEVRFQAFGNQRSWMQADGRRDARMLPGKLEGVGGRGQISPDGEQVIDACLVCALQEGGDLGSAVAVQVDMAIGEDGLLWRLCCTHGRSFLR
jgi:hypothetical protein